MGRPHRRTLSAAARLLGAGVLAGACVTSCDGDAPQDVPAAASAQADVERDGPPQALWSTVDSLRASVAAHYDASDGGGRAWLERTAGQAPYATSATPDRFTLHYEAGPHGIATGGTIFFQVSPFWDWSTPQVLGPDQRGYTTVTSDDPTIELRPATLDQQLLAIEVAGRPLVEGDRITVVYGAGLAGALPDRYAERDSPFWFAVDGDGDGTRRFLVDSPTIDVVAGPAAGLLMTVPTIVRPGERFRVTLAWVDAWRNTNVTAEGDVVIEVPEGLELRERVTFPSDSGGRRSVEGIARAPGLYRLRARAGEREVESNPMIVAAEGPRVLWGDLHGHSNFSDGTGLPEDYFIYARDVSGLDVVSLTDHDHWGILPLVQHENLWEEIRRETKRFHDPGRFVTLLGFEWTSWIHGHRHVLYFDDSGPLVDSVDPATESPTQLWAALEGTRALTFAHHSAGGPIATNWDIPPDPRFEPVTEVVSIHGSSESFDSPGLIYRPVEGHTVRDALDRGYVLGFIGSGDRHDGHPGAYQVDPPQGGLAAILAEENTRDAILTALRERRVYATNGPRMLLRFALGSHGMGSRVSVGAAGTLDESIYIHVSAQTPLLAVELIRSGELVAGLAAEGSLGVDLHHELEGLRPGEYVYVRAIQEDGGVAWSSPVFIEK